MVTSSVRRNLPLGATRRRNRLNGNSHPAAALGSNDVSTAFLVAASSILAIAAAVGAAPPAIAGPACYCYSCCSSCCYSCCWHRLVDYMHVIAFIDKCGCFSGYADTATNSEESKIRICLLQKNFAHLLTEEASNNKPYYPKDSPDSNLWNTSLLTPEP